MRNITLFFCLISFKLFSQNSNLERMIEISKNETLKNIYSYNIIKMYENDRFIDSNGFFLNGLLYSDLYQILKSPNFELILESKVIDIDYPDSNYSLIAFSLPRIEYQNFCDSTNTILVGISDLIINFPREYLVAIPNNYKGSHPPLKFISGNFIKTPIWVDFKDKGLIAQNMIDFVKIKCYSLGIEEISYKKKDKKWVWFDVKLKDKVKKRNIKMSIKNPDIMILTDGGKLEWRNDGTYGQGLFGD